VRLKDFDPRAYVNILVDIQFELPDITKSKSELLYNVKEHILEKSLLRDKRKNIIIIYGENGDVPYEVPYDRYARDTDYLQENFELIDIVKKLFDGPDKDCVIANNGQDVTPQAPEPIDTYLRQHTSKKTCLYFDYRKSTRIHNIIPFATINEEDEDLVAFEYKYGKSNIVVIPPYDQSKKEKSFEYIDDIFHSYNDSATLFDMIKVFKGKFKNQEDILKNIHELEMSFRNKLYVATILMCGRVIDMILPEDQECGARLQTLGTKLRWYNGQKISDKTIENKIIDDRLYELGKQFVAFRNWAAHPGKWSKSQIKYSDAKDAIDSLNIFVANYIDIKKKLTDYEMRKKEL